MPPGPELALRELHRRFVSSRRSGMASKSSSEIHRDPRAGPGETGNSLMARIVAERRGTQVGDLLVGLRLVIVSASPPQ